MEQTMGWFRKHNNGKERINTEGEKEGLFSLGTTMCRNMLNDKTVIFSLLLHFSDLASECDPSCQITVMLERKDPIVFQASLLSLLGFV